MFINANTTCRKEFIIIVFDNTSTFKNQNLLSQEIINIQ